MAKREDDVAWLRAQVRELVAENAVLRGKIGEQDRTQAAKIETRRKLAGKIPVALIPVTGVNRREVGVGGHLMIAELDGLELGKHYELRDPVGARDG